jgi:hypothetical protein
MTRTEALSTLQRNWRLFDNAAWTEDRTMGTQDDQNIGIPDMGAIHFAPTNYPQDVYEAAKFFELNVLDFVSVASSDGNGNLITRQDMASAGFPV